jgi:hypothetical protein
MAGKATAKNTLIFLMLRIEAAMLCMAGNKTVKMKAKTYPVKAKEITNPGGI